MAGAIVEKSEAVGVTEETSERTLLDEDTPEYLTGWPLASMTMALMFCAFMLALDNTILATAIPQITSDFKSLDNIGWYASSYLISQMALLPTCGRIYTFYNIKWTYIMMLLVFELGSVICAVAPNSIILIVGRAIAGLGAAGLLSGSTAITSYCAALEKRAMLLAMILGLYGVGAVAGPLIGGVITNNKTLTWRFIFWINLPFGAVGLAQIWFALKSPPPPAKAGLSRLQKLRQLDIPGATLLISAITCLLLALQWGGTVYPWSDAKVFGCLIGFGVIIIAFFALQIKDKESCTIPLYIFRNRTVCAACGFTLFLQIAIVVQSYYWPIYFQSVKGANARDSGIYMLPIIISNSLGTFVTSWVISKVGYYVPFMWVGAPMLAAGGGLYQLLRPHSPVLEWVGFQIVSGIGYGISSPVPILAVQVVLDKPDVPTGCVMIIFFQCIGGAMATSIGQNLFINKLLKVLNGVEGIDSAAVVRAGAKDFRELIPPELVDKVIEAFGSALKDAFLLALACPLVALVISLAMEWRKLPRDRKKVNVTTECNQAPLTQSTEK